MRTFGALFSLYLVYCTTAISVIPIYFVFKLINPDGIHVEDFIFFTILQLTSVLYLPILPIFAGADTAALRNLLLFILRTYGVIGVCWIFPLAYIVFVITNVGITVALKWLLVGKTKPGIINYNSWFRNKKYFVELMTSFSFKQCVSLAMGTPGVNLFLKALGSKIGKYACIRVSNGLPDVPEIYKDPDLLSFGDYAHIGDRAMLETATYFYSEDKEGELLVDYGPISFDEHALLGSGAVALPHSEIPYQGAIGAMSLLNEHTKAKEQVMHLGNPCARPLYHIPKLPPKKLSLLESVAYYISPILQPFLIIAILTITAFFSALLSVQEFFGEAEESAGSYIYPTFLLWIRLPITILVFGSFTCFFAIVSKWMLLGKLNNDDIYGIYSIKYFSWNFVLLVVTAAHLLFTEILRGSPFYNVYLRLLGVTIGSNCYIEALNIPDFDLMEIGDDVYIGSQVILTAHTYEAPNISRDEVKIGNRCVVSTASATLPAFTMEDGAELSSLSLGMKGMTVSVQEIE